MVTRDWWREHAEKALHYLAETDEEFGQVKAYMLAGKERLKTEYARAYLETNARDKVDDRKSIAHISETYVKALDKYEDDSMSYEIMRNKRLRAELTIEMWRTIEASRRKGNVV